MLEYIRLSCPSCGEEIADNIHLGDRDKIKCTNPQCSRRDIYLKICEVQCIHCKENNRIFIPEETQILETHYVDTPCKADCNEKEKNKRKEKGGKFYFLRCEERRHSPLHPCEVEFRCKNCKRLLHAILIRGERSTCLLKPNDEGIPVSLLGAWATKFGGIIEKIMLRFHSAFGGCKPFIGYARARRLGEIFFCFLLVSIFAIFYHSLFLIFNHSKSVSIEYSIFVIVALASLLYFSFLILRETVIVLGEIETKSTEKFKYSMYDWFFTFRKMWVAIIGIMFGLLAIIDEILLWRFSIPIPEIRWLDSIAVSPRFGIVTALMIPIFFGFGAFLYGLWSYSSPRYPNRVFRSDFLEIAPSIEKLSEIAIHTVLFFASILFANEIFYKLFYVNSPLGKAYATAQPEIAEIAFFWHSLLIGAVILPLVLFFLYLGKIVRDLKAMEFRWIDDKMKKQIYFEEKQSLALYRAEVRRALGWIGGVDYAARFLLLAYVGIVMSKIMGMPMPI